MPATRSDLLRQLIEYRLPVEATLAELSTFGWDSERRHAHLKAQDVESILKRYLTEELSADQVTDWADLIECREDIEPESGDSRLSNFIFRLANPNLNTEVTPALARELLTELGASGASDRTK